MDHRNLMEPNSHLVDQADPLLDEHVVVPPAKKPVFWTSASIQSKQSTSSGPFAISSGLSEWWKELLAAATAIVALLGLVLTLYYLNHDPLPNWSLNSVISIYSVLFKGCLLYTVSSAICQRQWAWVQQERPLSDITRYNNAQESLGAIRWLLYKPWKDPLTALGAVIVAASLFIDPFVQQLIDYDDCSINLAQIATIPRTNYFNPEMIHDGPLTMTPLPAEMTAWNSGLFSAPPDVNLACPTGNCTYSISYSSVGFCTECTDISSDVQIKCTNNTVGGATIIPVFSLPSGLTVNQTTSNGQIDVFAAGPNSDTGDFELLSGSTACQTGAIKDKNGGTKGLEGCDGSEASKKLWRCRGYGAASCTIGPCIKTYHATVEAGVITETVLNATSPFDNFGGDQPLVDSILDTSCITSNEREQLIKQGYIINPGQRWAAYNLTYDLALNLTAPLPNTSFPLSMIDRKCLYFIKHQFVTGYLGYFLYYLLRGTVTGQYGASATLTTYNGSQILQHMYNFGYNDFDWVDGILQNASIALTNHMRQAGQEGFSVGAEGVMHHFATCISIDWAWIALPATLVALAIVLLGLSILATAKHGLPVWKSSPLAYLLHGRINDTQVPNSLSAMEEMSKQVTVKLESSDGALALVRTGTEAAAASRSFLNLRKRPQ